MSLGRVTEDLVGDASIKDLERVRNQLILSGARPAPTRFE
jgi:hypothetical protein